MLILVNALLVARPLVRGEKPAWLAIDVSGNRQAGTGRDLVHHLVQPDIGALKAIAVLLALKADGAEKVANDLCVGVGIKDGEQVAAPRGKLGAGEDGQAARRR